MNIFINKRVWDKFTPKQMSEYKEEVFQYYRKNGFPYYNLTKDQIKKAYEQLENFDLDSIIQDDVVRQTMHGLALCWHFHPYSFNIRCGGLKTPVEAFSSDPLLRLAIDKRIKYGTFMTPAGMRKSIRTVSGVQTVSNFRPSAAAAIYRKFNGENVWDMSAGFGGRMLGAIASNTVKHYIGTDPSTQAIEGNRKMLADLKRLTDQKPHILVETFKLGSEIFVPNKESLDICMSSPPYFSTEQYSDEDTQSYKMYPTKKEWLDGFLKRTLENCYYGLKKNGWLIINIADVKSFPDLTQNFLQIADQLKFKYRYTLRYQLSRIMGNKKKGTFKYENIYCFTK